MTYTIKGEARPIPMTPGEAALLDGAIAYLSERVEVPTGCVVEWDEGALYADTPEFGEEFELHNGPAEAAACAIAYVTTEWLALLMELRRCADIAPPE